MRSGLRKKMFLISLAVSVSIAAIIGFSLYNRAGRLFFENFRLNKLSLARALAGSLDGEEMQVFDNPGVLDDPAYQETLAYLRTVKGQNSDISHLYVIVYDAESGYHRYALDANVNEVHTLWIENEYFAFIARIDQTGGISLEYGQETFTGGFSIDLLGSERPVRIEKDGVFIDESPLFSVLQPDPLIIEAGGGVLRETDGPAGLSRQGTLTLSGETAQHEDVAVRFTLGLRGYPESIPGEPFNEFDEESVDEFNGYLAANRDYADEEFEESIFGSSLFIYSIVHGRAGEPMAILAIEVWAREVLEYRRSVLLVTVLVSVITFVLSVVVYILVIENLVIKALHRFSRAAEEIGRGNFGVRLTMKRKDEIGELAQTVNQMAEGLRERDLVKELFGKYVQKEVADHALRSGISLGGKRQSATVLFSDIRRFTSLAENLDPEAVVSLLNRYFTQMVEHIIAHRGVLDKYIGDALMVHFGILGSEGRQADDAVHTAIEMTRSLHAFNTDQRRRGEPEIDIGMGIHTGELVAGNIGSPNRMEYTVIGDTVNLASRAEGLTKVFGSGIVITESTYQYLQYREAYLIRPLDLVEVKGRAAPVQMYEVFEGDVEVLRETKRASMETLREARALYGKRLFGEADRVLRRCARDFGADPLIDYYLRNCDHLMKHPPGDEWDGRAVMLSK